MSRARTVAAVAMSVALTIGLAACGGSSPAAPCTGTCRQYPPTTPAGVAYLARHGRSAAIDFVGVDRTRIGNCSNPLYRVTVATKVGGRALAADMLAFLLSSESFGGDCAVTLYASHTNAQAIGTSFAAGAVRYANHRLIVSTSKAGTQPAFSVRY